jgi:phosphoribosyl 1,2-cyclic phosphodiesterase
MLIRCWGSRGSIPVSGREYLKYGGDTACIEVRTDGGDVVVIDAGSGIRRLGNQLLAEGVRRAQVLFTHAHWDHVLGFPFFGLIYQESAEIGVFGYSSAQKSIHQMVSETMAAPNFPVPLQDVRANVVFHESDDCGEPFELAGLSVHPIILSHPDRGLGYRVVDDGRSFVILTDNELGYRHEGGRSFDDYARFCEGVDLLMHDAVYTPDEYDHTRSWGHSTYVDALDLAMRAQVKALGLFHHHHDRTDDQIDAIVADCSDRIARAGAELECFAVSCETQRRL